MRQPPSPLLLSARKRRPRRNPPRGAQQFGAPAAESGHEQQPSQQAQQGAADGEKCALLERSPGYAPSALPEDDDSAASSR